MCTRVFWSDNPIAKVAGRTFDWEVSDHAELWVLPRGLERDGGVDGAAVGGSTARWTSAYGSLAVRSFGVGASDVLNEAGLAVHLLYLEATEYEQPDGRPVVSNIAWAQRIADRCATVAEAVAALDEVAVVSVPVLGQDLGAHLALEDASGDSAIVELLGGRKVVHHGPSTTVLANDPDYDAQLANLGSYRGFGGELAPPGDILSPNRFVRASYFLSYLPEPRDYDEVVAGAVLLARNVAVPPGAPYDDFSVYPTWWISASDVTNRVLYFQPSTSPNLVWVELDPELLEPGTPARRLDPHRRGLVGDVGGLFEVAPPPA